MKTKSKSFLDYSRKEQNRILHEAGQYQPFLDIKNALNSHLEWHKEYDLGYFLSEPKQECKVCPRCLGVDGCMCALEPEELKKKYPLPTNTKKFAWLGKEGYMEVPTNTKEEVREKIEEMITEFYFIYCQKDKRPEFKELDESQNWTDHQKFKASSLVQHMTNQLLALLDK
jgi:hypothetical protein